MNLFETKVRFEKTLENGIIKHVNGIYLVDEPTFGSAEERITKEMQPFISGEFEVSAIKKVNYSDLFTSSNGDKYYDCKIGLTTIDEKTAKEKKTFSHILVLADNIDEAKKNLDEGMKGTISDYVVDTIKETKIMDIYN